MYRGGGPSARRLDPGSAGSWPVRQTDDRDEPRRRRPFLPYVDWRQRPLVSQGKWFQGLHDGITYYVPHVFRPSGLHFRSSRVPCGLPNPQNPTGSTEPLPPPPRARLKPRSRPFWTETKDVDRRTRPPWQQRCPECRPSSRTRTIRSATACRVPLSFWTLVGQTALVFDCRVTSVVLDGPSLTCFIFPGWPKPAKGGPMYLVSKLSCLLRRHRVLWTAGRNLYIRAITLKSFVVRLQTWTAHRF